MRYIKLTCIPRNSRSDHKDNNYNYKRRRRRRTLP